MSFSDRVALDKNVDDYQAKVDELKTDPLYDNYTECEYEGEQVSLRQFLGNVDMSKYWSYEGSLTTPPCTEGIKWSVIKQVQSLSKKQL